MTRERYDELLRELNADIIGLSDMVVSRIGDCMATLEALDAGKAQALIDGDSEVDDKRYDIENRAFLLIATQQPMAGDLREIVAILTMVNELERIADYCAGIAKLTLRMAAEPVQYFPTDIRIMADITQQLLRQTSDAFRTRDLKLAEEVWTRDDEVDALYEAVFRKMLLDMATDKTSVRLGTYVLWVGHNVERMADRVTNIAEQVAFVVTGDIPAFRQRLRSQTMPV